MLRAKGIVNGVIFQSTHPVRGATSTREMLDRYDIFQSTHPVRGATEG